MKYNILYIDPPWEYRVWRKKGSGRSAESHYNTMSISELCALPVANIAAKDSALFLWVTYPVLPDAFKLLEAWGYTYKTVAFTWVKRNRKSNGWHIGMGHWTRSNAELCLLATKGSPRRVAKNVRQIVDTPLQEHSRKPDVVRDRIVDIMGDLPRIELFARMRVSGWDATGFDVDGRDIRDFLLQYLA